jgi:hypothetical protein
MKTTRQISWIVASKITNRCLNSWKDSWHQNFGKLTLERKRSADDVKDKKVS